MLHFYLSPHPDDAAFSCGGQIAQLVRRGEKVVVYTAMSGYGPANLVPNGYIAHHHERWRIGDDVASVVDNRRAEDGTAIRALGAQVVHGPFPDALYRADPNSGEALYTSREALFGAPHPADPLEALTLAKALMPALQAYANGAPAAIYAPLGVGGHVDHVLARDAGLILAESDSRLRAYFYEEYPYAREERRVILAALQAFGQPLMRVNYTLDEAALGTKIAASACYRSQISTFWPDEAALGQELRAYHAATGGETVWRLIRQDDFGG